MNANSSSANPIKEFEDTFDACVGLLANSNCQQSNEGDEMKLSVEQCAQKFLDKARELEAFFMQKRYQISSQRPEQMTIEDLNEIKNEILRKDQLIERFNEKINYWQNILSDNPLPAAQQPILIGQQNLVMNNMQAANLQQQQMASAGQQQSMGLRQRSPIQQPMMQSTNSMRPQMMSPHPYQAQTYTPQIMNVQPNQQGTPGSATPSGSMMPDSPMNHQMQNQMHPMQSGAYSPAGSQQTVAGSHLSFLEKTTSSIGLGPEARR